jgi:hypothetical protein
MTAQEQITLLVQQGLSKKNLYSLIALCEGLIAGKPAVYGSLICIFRLLEQEYELHDAIDPVRYNTINPLLRQPLIDLIDAENQSARAILEGLDDVQNAVEALSH